LHSFELAVLRQLRLRDGESTQALRKANQSTQARRKAKQSTQALRKAKAVHTGAAKGETLSRPCRPSRAMSAFGKARRLQG